MGSTKGISPAVAAAVAAAQNSGHPHKKKPSGRPFKPGEPPPVGRAFPAGQSGNPGGRPATEKAFRERCRELATELLEHLTVRTKAGKLSAPQVSFVQDLFDRAGYIVPKQLQLGGTPDGEPIRFESDNPVSAILRELISRQSGGEAKPVALPAEPAAEFAADTPPPDESTD